MDKSDFPGLQGKTPPLKPEEARIEANRCLYCFDAPCVQACPTRISIPRFIKQIEQANLIGSAATILDANPTGHSCARVCPVEVLCEGACVYRDWQNKPIQIGRLQRFATDHVYGRRLRLIEAGPDNGKKAAVIGSGPGGLSCAAYLRRLGFAVTLFEAKKRPGGLNTSGVAEYKMDQPTALDEAAMLLELGVDIRFGVELGKDITFQTVSDGFDAVFLAVGLGRTLPLGIPGENLRGVHEALPFIEWVKNGEFEKIPPGERTVCIGGGNTAIDVVTQARRTGAPSVVLAYRRSEEEMPAYGFEVDLAKSDGVRFEWHAAPVEILGTDRVEGVRFVRTRTEGKKPVAIPGSEFEIRCDRVVKAVGQSKQKELLARAGVELDAKGRIVVDAATLRTSNRKFYAGGDAVNGGKEVVNAAADGKRAALGIFRAVFPGREPGPEHRSWIATIDGGAHRSARPAKSHAEAAA